MNQKPLSLYFDIPKGEHANLEVVARATLEWVGIIREIAEIVAPGIEFDVELVNTEEGSLWITNLIKAVREGDRKALSAIVGGVLAFFAAGPFLHLQADAGNKVLELMGHKDFAEISDKDKRDIAKLVVQLLRDEELEARRHNLIREVEKDRRVKAIGVAPRPTVGGPAYRIPRADFPFYHAPPPKQFPGADKMTAVETSVPVSILRASLKPGDTKPKWRFQAGDEAWSAVIEDEEFIRALNSQGTGLPLAVGQRMVVDVLIEKRILNGEVDVSRRITRVIDPKVNRRQGQLGLGGE